MAVDAIYCLKCGAYCRTCGVNPCTRCGEPSRMALCPTCYDEQVGGLGGIPHEFYLPVRTGLRAMLTSLPKEESYVAKVSDIYGSGNRLKADHLNGQPYTLQVAGHRIVNWEAEGDKPAQSRIWLSFLGTDKELQLNVSSARNLAQAWGDDCDGWPGKAVMVMPRKTNMGDTIDAIPAPANAVPSTGPDANPAPPPPPAPAPQAAAAAPDDSEIPF